MNEMSEVTLRYIHDLSNKLVILNSKLAKVSKVDGVEQSTEYADLKKVITDLSDEFRAFKLQFKESMPKND